MQFLELLGEVANKHLGHLRFPPGDVGITDSLEVFGPAGRSAWPRPLATRCPARTGPRSPPPLGSPCTASRLGTGSPGRFCADRASASAAAAIGPGLSPSKRLDQAAKTPAASRAAPRHAARSDTGTALSFSTASRCPPPPVASRPGRPRMASLPRNDRLGGAPFDDRRLAILR